jgi:hypothetical protein
MDISMKNVLFIVVICLLFGCDFSKEKTKFRGTITIALIAPNNSPEYLLKDEKSTYYLKFSPTTISEGLSLPYPDADCYQTHIGKENVFLHSNSSYLIIGELVKGNTKSIKLWDSSTMLSGQGTIPQDCSYEILNVTNIKEISRGSGECIGYMCIPLQGGDFMLTKKTTRLTNTN